MPVLALADRIGDRAYNQPQEHQAYELRTGELGEECCEERGQRQQAQDGTNEFERERNGALGVQEILQVHSVFQRGTKRSLYFIRRRRPPSPATV